MRKSPVISSDTPLVVELCDVLQNTLRCQGADAKSAILGVVQQLIAGPHAVDGVAPVVPGTSALFAAMEVIFYYSMWSMYVCV